MISAYEHGWNAARRGKHIQACPYDAGTAEWQEWRDGFSLSRVNACKRRSRWHGACHVLLRNSVVADRMKFIDSLVANTTTSPQRDVGDGKGNSSDLGVAG